MASSTQDFRDAVRSLRRSPGSSAVAIGALALGLGACTAALRIADVTLLRPLPFRDPGRLVAIWENDARRHIERNVVSPANLTAWRERSRSFEALAGHAAWESNLTGPGTPERVPIGAVTSGFFDVLGVPPVLGRTLRAEDSRPGAPDVVVVSRAFWRTRLGADPDAVGRPIYLGGQPTTVVGVVPDTVVVPARARIWVPLTEDDAFRTTSGRWLTGIGRLRAGVSIESARAEVAALAGQLAVEEPRRNAGWGAATFGLAEDLRRDVRPVLVLLVSGAGLLLLIACVNAGSLLLARALSRDRDRAVRVSLGATTRRLVVPVALEALFLSLLAGALGVLLGEALLPFLASVLPAGFADLLPARPDARSLALALATALGAGILVSVPPLARVTSTAGADLRDGAGASSLDPSARRAGRLLVLVELAVSAALLVVAGLVGRSFLRLAHVDPGFQARGVISFRVAVSGPAYREDAAVGRLHERVVEELRSLPGAGDAGAMSWRPFTTGAATSFHPLDRPEPTAGTAPVADIRIVTPGLFRALGIPLVAGRTFGTEDRAGQPASAVVDGTVARTLWPGRDPLGQRLRLRWGPPPGLEVTIVGVVGDVRLGGLGTPPRETIYLASAQGPSRFMTYVVGGSPRIEDVRAAMRRVDPGLPLADLAPLTSFVEESIARPRDAARFAVAFAGAALLLAAVGLFGVVSSVVARRSRELGVRAAVGARPADLARLVLSESLALGVAGAAVGLLGARLTGRLLSDLLFETRSEDPVIAGGAVALIVLVSLLASALPARRAARLDPVRILRSE